MVLDAIHSEGNIPLKTAPLIFVATILTHLFGGSAGREGAALQLGGSIGNFIGKTLRIDENDRRVMIMCGMSAAFSALFGTPMAAAVFFSGTGPQGLPKPQKKAIDFGPATHSRDAVRIFNGSRRCHTRG